MKIILLKSEQIWRLLLIICLSVFLSACNDSEEVIVEEGGEPPVEDDFIIDDEPVEEDKIGACYVDEYGPQTGDVNDEKLDILIVTYGSMTLRKEREQLAEDFDGMLAALPEGVDYRVGVMMGYGSSSSASGKLYRRSSGQPYVMDSSTYTEEEIRSMVMSRINPPTLDMVFEALLGRGSHGLYSLNKALTTNYQSIQDQGFFRDDAALSVIFVSDQSDVCAVYPEGAITRNSRLRSTQGSARYNSYQQDCVENDVQVITPNSVFDQLKYRQGEKPLLLGGFVYNNPNTIPSQHWKEYGYGYLNIIGRAGGISHDLATRDYWDGLFRMGTVVSASVAVENEFNVSAENVYLPTIKVFVDDSRIPHTYVPELNQIHISSDHRDPLATVRVEYCERQVFERENIYLEAGGNHSCVIHLDGSVRCWGQNFYGQLGQGHSDDLGGEDSPVSEIPPLVFDERAVSIAAGGSHTCALFENGGVRCWGQNDHGQLGLGDTENRGILENATELPYLDFEEEVLSIYAGTHHSCAIVESGRVKCWGANLYGQLGLGDTEKRGDTETVGEVPYLAFGSDEVLSLDLSSISNHSCALLEDRDMVCWGRNTFGQLGLGHDQNIGDVEGLANAPLVNTDDSARPSMMTTGNGNTCALFDNQNMKCWGINHVGQLGYPDVDYIGLTDVPADYDFVNFGAGITDIASSNIATCAVSTTNEVKCWGGNNVGQLGQNGTQNMGLNENIDDIEFLDLAGYSVEKVVGGTLHHCALTRDEGKVLCWGSNIFGQLGYADNISTGDAGAATPAERGTLEFYQDE